MNLVFIAIPFIAKHKLITITIKAKLLPSSAQLQLQLASARSAGVFIVNFHPTHPTTHPGEKILGQINPLNHIS